MKTRVKGSTAVAVAIVGLLSFAGTVRSHEDEASAYHSPSGVFSFPMPVSEEFNPVVKEGARGVSIMDDLCRLYRVEYTEVTDEESEQLEAGSHEEVFSEFLEATYMSRAIRSAIPTATVEQTEYLGDELGGALYGEVLLPGGSICTVTVNEGEAERVDSRRGVLIFAHDGLIFVVSTAASQVTAHVAGGMLDEPDTSAHLRDLTLTFARSLDFGVE